MSAAILLSSSTTSARMLALWASGGPRRLVAVARVARLGVALDRDQAERLVEPNVDRRAVPSPHLDLVRCAVLRVPLDGVCPPAACDPQGGSDGPLGLRPGELGVAVVERARRAGDGGSPEGE